MGRLKVNCKEAISDYFYGSSLDVFAILAIDKIMHSTYSYEVIKDNGLIGYKNILVEIQIIVGVSDAGVFKVRLNTAHF